MRKRWYEPRKSSTKIVLAFLLLTTTPQSWGMNDAVKTRWIVALSSLAVAGIVIFTIKFCIRTKNLPPFLDPILQNAGQSSSNNNQDQLIATSSPTQTDSNQITKESSAHNRALITCPICLEEFTQTSAELMILTCSHYLCTNCHQSWIPTNPTCPICRRPQP